MIINLKEINYYFLTTGNNKQRCDHMKEMLKNYNYTEINPPMDIKENDTERFKHKSGIIGFYRMIHQGLKDQDKNKPFIPFVIFEDDANIYKKIPDNIDVPDDADIVYLGLSSQGWSGSGHMLPHSVDINNDYVRTYNMLGGHSIMFCTPLGASAYQRALVENYYTRLFPWDIPFADSQSYYNVYALKIPLFYQDKNLGGQELPTKITLKDGNILYESEQHHIMPTKYVSKPFRSSFRSPFMD